MVKGEGFFCKSPDAHAREENRLDRPPKKHPPVRSQGEAKEIHRSAYGQKTIKEKEAK